jgi:hypothetical protein
LADSTDFLLEFAHAESGCSIIFDDDGRVAYAYFLNYERKIVGDVWVYNRCETPAEPEWTEKDRAPFVNSAGYVASHKHFEPVADGSDVKVNWQRGDEGQLIACIFIRKQLAAILAAGQQPGWSTLAAKDGPLARTMETSLLLSER